MPDENPTGGGDNPAGGGDNNAPEITPEVINQNWRSAVEKEFAEHPSTADFTDLNGVLKSYVNQQKLIGGDKLPKPSSKWGKAEWAEFNKEIGMPDSPDKYELDKADGMSDDDMDWFKNFAHGELNLSNRQAQNLWTALHGRSNEKTKSFMDLKKKAMEEGYSNLKDEWGNKYDDRVAKTNQAIQKLDEDGRFRKWMKDTGINQEPEMLRFAAKVAESFGEDRVGSGESPSVGMSKEAAKAKLNKLFSEAHQKGRQHPMFNKKDPSHGDVVAEITKLSEIAGGGGYNG